jgi:hypothetical protein
MRHLTITEYREKKKEERKFIFHIKKGLAQ